MAFLVAVNSPRSLVAATGAGTQTLQTEVEVSEPTPIIYDGNDEECTLCMEQFKHGERVCRLACLHMYHAHCWDHYTCDSRTIEDPISSGRQIELTASCPNCRGSPALIAIWTYIDPTLVTQSVNVSFIR